MSISLTLRWMFTFFICCGVLSVAIAVGMGDDLKAYASTNRPQGNAVVPLSPETQDQASGFTTTGVSPSSLSSPFHGTTNTRSISNVKLAVRNGESKASDTQHMQPRLSSSGAAVTEVSKGYAHTCVLTNEHVAYCWGDNSAYQLGTNVGTKTYLTGVGTYSDVPLPVDTMTCEVQANINPAPQCDESPIYFTELASNATHTCGISFGSRLYCWGDNKNKITQVYSDSAFVRAVTDASITIPAGADIAIKNLRVGKTNACFMIGFPGFSNPSSPLCVIISMSSESDGSINYYCQMGYDPGGAIPNRCLGVLDVASWPIEDTFAADITVGLNHICYLTFSTAKIVCWGANGSGQLGIGVTSLNNVFARVNTSTIKDAGYGFAQISAGAKHTCVLVKTHKLYCWGDNTHGQLGDGTTTQRTTPVAVKNLDGVTVVRVYAGATHTCATTDTGTMYCWGANTYGALGHSATNTKLPSLVAGLDGLSNGTSITDVAIDSGFETSPTIPDQYSRSCAVTSTGNVYCWGRNNGYLLGLGSVGLLDSYATYQKVGTFVDSASYASKAPQAIALGAGDAHTCLLSNQGSVWCMGDNRFGQLGNNRFASLSPGDWGVYDWGQQTNRVPTIVRFNHTNYGKFIALAVGSKHNCVIADASPQSVWCWGDNEFGQLGTSDLVQNALPTQVTGFPSGIRFASVSAGAGHSCALSSTGIAYCWGRNTNGQLGINTNSGDYVLRTSATAITMPSGVTFTAITAGYNHTCALGSNQAAYCWGANTEGQLGNSSKTQSLVAVRVSMPASTSFIQISAGNSTTCAISSSNDAWCWGANQQNQLGNDDSTKTSKSTPVKVKCTASGDACKFVKIVTAKEHTCALAKNGSSYCWGSNSQGQQGFRGSHHSNGTTDWPNNAFGMTFPRLAVNLTTRITDIAVGERHSCALSNQTTWCWGNNERGQRGNAAGMQERINPFGPTSVSPDVNGLTSLSAVSTVSVGTTHSCALVSGTAYCWGSNAYGELGTDFDTQEFFPTAVTFPLGVSAYVSIGTGQNFTCALANTGKIYCWGSNRWGQLGRGTSDPSSFEAQQVTMPGALTAFKKLSVGTAQTCAIGSDDKAYCWGRNSVSYTCTDGDLSCSVTTNTIVSIPTIRDSVHTFSSISTGGSLACALKSNGSAFCWGANINGQAGNGTTTSASSPRAVSMPSGVTFQKISVGDNHACATTSTSDLYCWGMNTYGQLGDNTTTTRKTPVKINKTQLGYNALLNYKSISLGANFTCAVLTVPNISRDVPACWGQNSDGQLGNGSTTAQSRPVSVRLPDTQVTVKNIFAATNHACAINSSDKVICWGNNRLGQLGLNPESLFVPGHVGLNDYDLKIYPTLTPTTQPSRTRTATTSATPSATRTQTRTFTRTQTRTFTRTQTRTFTRTQTRTFTRTQTRTFTRTQTRTFTRTQTRTFTRTQTRTTTNTATRTASVTLSPTMTVTIDSSLRLGSSFTAIDTGGQHTCALAEGKAYCWGKNEYGQLGDGTQKTRRLPQPVTMPVSVNFEKISAGTSHSCAISTAGAAYCWGYNNHGQLGNGDNSNTNRYTAVLVSLPGVVLRDVTAGTNHTCALAVSGSVYCWGNNTDGELGNGAFDSSNVPVLVSFPAGVSSFVSVKTLHAHTCAISNTKKAYCWGNNVYGQLGDGTDENRNTPTMVELGGSDEVSTIGTGYAHSCAQTTTGIYCWGENTFGQFGDTTTNSSYTPVAVAMPLGIVLVSLDVGNYAACGQTATNRLYCWGYNATGVIGDGTTTLRDQPTATNLWGDFSFTSVSIGAEHVCAIAATNSPFCWGTNTHGQLGVDDTIKRLSPEPVKIGRVSVGVKHTCAMNIDNNPWCWGSNSVGEIGDGTNLPRSKAVPIAGAYTQMSLGLNTSCGLTRAGSVQCWGWNNFGQNGSGSTAPYSAVPVTVSLPGASSAVQISNRLNHICALDSTQNISCWGHNFQNSFGNGPSGDEVNRTPVALNSVEDTIMGLPELWRELSVGNDHTCAIGTVPYCWGYNGSGELGNGESGYWTTSPRPAIVSMPTGISFNQIQIGVAHSCAVTNEGKLYCWGLNDRGQLGDGTIVNRTTPAAATAFGDIAVRSFVVGEGYTCILKADRHSFWCVGENLYGQLGDGTNENRLTPVAVDIPMQSGSSSPEIISQLAANSTSTCAVTLTGRVYCWGLNDQGQLGDGTTNNRNTPVLVYK